jgi:GNAT superfamily N-acetyltransferase
MLNIKDFKPPLVGAVCVAPILLSQRMPLMTIQVTVENPFDAICIELVRELSAELGPLYGTDGTALFSPADVTIPRAAFVVAWLNDEAVGCGALRPMDDDTIAEVKRMYVRPVARGNGISRKIL